MIGIQEGTSTATGQIDTLLQQLVSSVPGGSWRVAAKTSSGAGEPV